jgi:hypothetical protein
MSRVRLVDGASRKLLPVEVMKMVEMVVWHHF